MSAMQRVVTLMVLGAMILWNAGCALLGTALGAGMAYGIYAATNK